MSDELAELREQVRQLERKVKVMQRLMGLADSPDPQPAGNGKSPHWATVGGITFLVEADEDPEQVWQDTFREVTRPSWPDGPAAG
jgi:hypothetical protein